jgi:hypothetical protein
VLDRRQLDVTTSGGGPGARKGDWTMRSKKKSEAFFSLRAEVWFDERTGTIEISRTDPGHRRQRLSCTFEQWEQIRHAVEHLFTSVDPSGAGWEEVRDVRDISPN